MIHFRKRLRPNLVPRVWPWRRGWAASIVFCRQMVLYISTQNRERKKKRLCTTTLLQVRKMNVSKQILPFWFFVFVFVIVTAPVVMLMAPLGSLLGTHFHRQVLAALIYILDTISLVTAFAILPLSGAVIGLSVGMLVFGFAFFSDFSAWSCGLAIKSWQILKRKRKRKGWQR